MDDAYTIYLIAGEPSGDLLGAHLMRSLRAQSEKPIRFYGIGGPKMAEEGLDSLFAYEYLSIMGAAELIPHLVGIFTRIALTVDDIKNAKQPDMLVTIDSPGFCFRVVERLRKANFNTKYVHYVAPTVWAYKPQRAEYCAKLYDHMLVLLPFEPPYFQKVGLPCTFVGHPVVAETQVGDAAAFRAKYELLEHTPVICLLPGSRKGEVKRHMPVFARAVAMLATSYPNLVITIAVPEHALPLLAPYLNTCPFRVIIAEDEQDKKNAMAASHFAFVKSGTVAFEVAMAGVPMLITYRMNAFSVWYLRRMIRTKFVNLINILLKREVIPELLQELCTPLALASCASTLMAIPALQAHQRQHMRAGLERLLPGDGKKPSEVAANSLLALLKK